MSFCFKDESCGHLPEIGVYRGLTTFVPVSLMTGAIFILHP